VPLSNSLLTKHFQGEHILGCYPLLADGTLYFIASDLDNHDGERDPLKDLLALWEVCQVNDVPLHALRSKSGLGIHAYVFFLSPVLAWKARLVFFALLREADVIGDDVELSSFDKLIPDQDDLDGKKFGNLIALPFQGNAAKQGHTFFLDPATGFTKPYPDQWEVLKNLTRWNEAGVDSRMTEWRLTREQIRKTANGTSNPPGWVVEALQGVAAGARDTTGSKLAGYFTDKKIPADIIGAVLSLWKEVQIQKIVSSISRYQVNGDPQHEDDRIGVSFVGSQGSS
jgi:TOTE conflict system, Archaeo-Eukaryotic Primase domain